MISIDTLPDDALLVIFDHHLYGVRQEGYYRVEKAWQSLVQVCRRWRNIVIESPRRLGLCLVCTGQIPARDRLDIWPTLPIIIQVYSGNSIRNADNIIAALERTDRVSQIYVEYVWSSYMEIILPAMQQPFPNMTNLYLRSIDETVLFPDSFLGGSVPRLEVLALTHIPFPGLPKLLLSATHLVTLHLYSIPHSGYFPPDAIATVLPTLTSLNSFGLGFMSPRSFPDLESRHASPSTRSVLPVLTGFLFKGVSEYLEDLVTRIDAPQLKNSDIVFINDVVFDTPQLIRFLSQTPYLKALEKAFITFRGHAVRVNFSSQTFRGRHLGLETSCIVGLHLPFLEQVWTSCLPPLSMLEDLYCYLDPQAYWKDNADNVLWVELLRSFSTLKNLYLSKNVAPLVAPALQELVEGRATEVLPTVLPALQNIFVQGLESSGPAQEGIRKFVAARQVCGHLVAGFSLLTGHTLLGPFASMTLTFRVPYLQPAILFSLSRCLLTLL
jgi:hypothetical protein